MKSVIRILTVALMLICISPLAAMAEPTIVDTDYSKQLPIKLLYLRDVTNADKTNAYQVNGVLTLEYKDFGAAGNSLKFRLVLTSSDGTQTQTYVASLRDISFEIYIKDNGNIYGYVCSNKYNEIQFTVSIEPDGNIISIRNMAILKEL